MTEGKACREYVMILKEAAKGQNEEIVNIFLEKRLTMNKAIRAKDVQDLFGSKMDNLPRGDLHCESLDSYAILGGGQ